MDSTTIPTNSTPVKERAHTIAYIEGDHPGPCVLFIGGVHGNEPSGVTALQQVADALPLHDITGTFIALAGNLPALRKGQRYEKQDLNRLWTEENIQQLSSGTFTPTDSDEEQLKALYKTIDDILASERGPFFFFDLHTTSSDTPPFITVNDSLLNRSFTSRYPIPTILGIEEYLDGPLLSYYNELGYISFGFEAGQHEARSSIESHVAFIYLTLQFTGLLKLNGGLFQKYYNLLSHRGRYGHAFFEIYEIYKIHDGEDFSMEPGYSNFQKIRHGEHIANSNGHPIRPDADTTIFMPLYQNQGNDGFFYVKRTRHIFLKLSAWLRKIHADRLLLILPGVTRHPHRTDRLVVDKRVARYFTKPILHLLGYRARTIDKNNLYIDSRDKNSKASDYNL